MRLISLLILSSMFISCASFSMGPRRSCDSPPPIPTKPVVHAIIANPGCSGVFAGQAVDLDQYVCFSPDDVRVKEIWIRDVLRACGN